MRRSKKKLGTQEPLLTPESSSRAAAPPRNSVTPTSTPSGAGTGARAHSHERVPKSFFRKRRAAEDDQRAAEQTRNTANRVGIDVAAGGQELPPPPPAAGGGSAAGRRATVAGAAAADAHKAGTAKGAEEKTGKGGKSGKEAKRTAAAAAAAGAAAAAAGDSQTKQSRKPNEVDPNFEYKNGYSWDFVVVFPFGPEAEEKEVSMTPDELVRRIQDAGLETYLYYSVQKDEIYCKIRAPLERLQTHADMIDYKMLLDRDRLRETAEWGIPHKGIKPANISHIPAITHRSPYENIFARYDTDPQLIDMYQYSEGCHHPFGQIHRIKLIVDILRAPTTQSGAGIRLYDLQKDGSILAYFPPHDLAKRDALAERWMVRWQWPWKQPIEDIRAYFGEKIAMYFAFLGHYTTWLLPLGLIGFIVFVDVVSELDTEATLVPYFCFIVSLWSVLLLEYWKRHESTIAMEWGMDGFEEEERDRPEFFGDTIKSFIDGREIKYFPPTRARKLAAVSQAVILSMIVLVIAAVTAVFFLKIFLTDDVDNQEVNDMGSSIASLANAVQIQVMNMLYQEVAVWLTNRENHRTDTEYEDALIAKLFAFQFVNSFASLYYIAFVKKATEGQCDYDDCMTELMNALGIIFVTRLISGNAVEMLLPRIKAYIRKRQEQSGAVSDQEPSRAENEYIMEEYDEMMGTLEDYAELSVQFGYVTLFVTAFPLAPALAFVSNYVEIRGDGNKLLFAYRRPIPSGAEDIGTWQAILTLTALAAVVTNCAVVCFTMNMFDFTTAQGRVWFFVGFQYTLFIIMGVFAYIVDDVPDDVLIQLRRKEFLVRKFIDCTPDEDDADPVERVHVPMKVHNHDDEVVRQPSVLSGHGDIEAGTYKAPQNGHSTDRGGQRSRDASK